MDSINITEEKTELQCLICGRSVPEDDIRDHLSIHNPNASAVDPEDAMTMFQLSTAGMNMPNRQRTVVVGVRGGVAEVEECPDDVTVVINDYDNERR